MYWGILFTLLLSACNFTSPIPVTTTTTTLPHSLTFTKIQEWSIDNEVKGTHQNPRLYFNQTKLLQAHINRSSINNAGLVITDILSHQSSLIPIKAVQQSLTKYQRIKPVGNRILLYSQPNLELISQDKSVEIVVQGTFEIYDGILVGNKEIILAPGTIDGVSDPEPNKPWLLYRLQGTQSFKRIKFPYGTMFSLDMKEYRSNVLVTSQAAGKAQMSMFDVDWLFSSDQIKFIPFPHGDTIFWSIPKDQQKHFADPLAVLGSNPILFSTVWDDSIVDMTSLLAIGDSETVSYKLNDSHAFASQINHLTPAIMFQNSLYIAIATDESHISILKYQDNGIFQNVITMEGLYPDMLIKDDTLYVSTTKGLWSYK